MRAKLEGKLSTIILILGLIILISVTVYVAVNDYITTSSNYYISAVLVEKEGVEYEVKIRKADKATIYREGKTETLLTRLPREGKKRLALPDLAKVEGKDMLLGKLPKSELTWNLSYLDSFAYIKYKLDTGYKLEMYASTPEYVELFLKKDKVRTRIVVFQESIMVGDMLPTAQLPEVYTYFKQYELIKEGD